MNMQKNLFKLTLMGVMLLMSNFIFSQVTETSEKVKTVNITCLYAVGWNVPQKDIWNGPTLMYLMP